MVSAILRIVQAIWLSILGRGALSAQAAISGSVVNDGGSVRIATDGAPNLVNLDGAYLRVIRVNDQLVSGSMIRLPAAAGTVRMELVISTEGATIEGAVGADQDFRRSRYRVAKSEPAGRFKLTGVAPGAYRHFAFEDIEEGAWLDARYMATYAGKGETVKVAEREARTVALRMIAGEE